MALMCPFGAMRGVAIVVVTITLTATTAHGQSLGGLGGGLPGRITDQVPGLPATPLDRPLERLRGVTDLTGHLVDEVGRAPSRLRSLIRSSDGTLEADPLGWPVVRGEIVAVGLSEPARAQALADGYTILREERLEALEITTVILSPPRGQSLSRAVARLIRADPDAEIGFNHVHTPAGSLDETTAPATRPSPPPAPHQSRSAARIGLIDTGVQTTHPALAAARVTQQGFAGPARPGAHGTAVASLLVGRSPPFAGAAPGTALFAADVYGGQPTGGSSTRLAQALAWMVQNAVPVVNVSLVGPRNPLVQTAVARAQARGTVIVAAVGNDGPAAPPLYPAAYPGVVGVNATSARGRPLPESGRGPQVDLAAQGTDMAAAGPGTTYVTVRGASFAAPLVAGLIARQGLATVTAQATDLGPRGRDDTYGAGWVSQGIVIAPAAVAARGVLRP